MNSFIKTLIRNREAEYRQELVKSDPDDDADSTTSNTLTHCDDLSSSIRVTILEDNPKAAAAAASARVVDRRGSEGEAAQPPPSPNEWSPQSVMELSAGVPSPPRVSARKTSSKKARRQSKQAVSTSTSSNSRISFPKRNKLRWGGGSDSSPTCMPKCPKRASLSPVQADDAPDSLPQKLSLSYIAASIVRAKATLDGVDSSPPKENSPAAVHQAVATLTDACDKEVFTSLPFR